MGRLADVKEWVAVRAATLGMAALTTCRSDKELAKIYGQLHVMHLMKALENDRKTLTGEHIPQEQIEEMRSG